MAETAPVTSLRRRALVRVAHACTLEGRQLLNLDEITARNVFSRQGPFPDDITTLLSLGTFRVPAVVFPGDVLLTDKALTDCQRELYNVEFDPTDDGLYQPLLALP